jgi:TolA-binding protein
LSVKDPRSDDQNATTANAESLKIVAEASKALEAKPEINFSAKEHFLRGLAHFGAKNFQSAIISFDNAIANNPDNEEFAKVLLGKALSLAKLDKSEEAIAVYEQIYQRYRKDNAPAMREIVATALFNKGVRLGALGKSEEAIAVYDLIDQRYRSDDAPAIREQVCKALVNQAVRLGALGKSEEAIAVYDQIDQRYRSDDTPAMRELVAKGLNGGAFRKIVLSKQQWTNLGNRTSYLKEALIKLERSLKICNAEDTALVQGNYGYALFLFGNKESAETHTLICLQLGGDKLLEAQRADAKMYRLEPEDTEYEALLEACWQKLNPKT